MENNMIKYIISALSKLVTTIHFNWTLISITHLKSTFFRKCLCVGKKLIKQYFSGYTLSSSFLGSSSHTSKSFQKLLGILTVCHRCSLKLPSNCPIGSGVFLSSSSAVRIVSTAGPKVLGLFSFPPSISDWPRQMARSLYIAGLLFFCANKSNSGVFALIFCYFLPFNYMILSAYT